MRLKAPAGAIVVAAVAALVLVACGGGSSNEAGGSSTASGGGAAKTTALEQIKQRGVIRVGLAVDPPFTLRTTSGKWYSFNPALVQKLGQELGVKVSYVATGWSTIVAGLQADKYDIIGASISATPERKKAIDFTIPYAYGGTTWIVYKSSKLKSLTSLNDPSVTIAFSTGTFQDQITHSMMPKAKYRALPNASYADLISELVAHHSDAVSVPSFLVAAVLQKFDWARAVPPGTKGADPTGIAWGIQKNEPELKNALSSFIREQEQNGTIKGFEKKYLTIENSLKG